ncbi:MAG: hypothetical protein ACRDJO_05340, partial [Actinomycetota bacterium]
MRRIQGLIVALLLLVGIMPFQPALADGGDFSIDFAAARPGTYDQAAGTGGQYGDGSNTFVVESLEGGDFTCGDRIVYFAAVTVDAGAPLQNIEIDFSFDSTPTGGGNAGFDDLELAILNMGDPGNTVALNLDSVPEIMTQTAPGTDPHLATVRITNLEGGERFILRLVARLTCPEPDEPDNGNVQARVLAARVIFPAGEADAINVGSQTVPLKAPGNVVQVLPTISVVKTAAPLTLPAPGGTFTFTVGITNTSDED